MKRDFYKTLKDRTLYYVPKSEVNADNLEKNPIGFANDGRPIRFVEYSNQPSGEFAVFEGSTKRYGNVKRIETDPILVRDMFNDTWEEYAPTGISAYDYSPITSSTQINKAYKQWQDASKTGNISLMAQSVRTMLAIRKSWPAITDLPPEVITANVPGSSIPVDDGKKESQDQEASGEQKSSFPWGLLAISAIAVIALAAGGSDKR